MKAHAGLRISADPPEPSLLSKSIEVNEGLDKNFDFYADWISARHRVFYEVESWCGVMEWSSGVESTFGVAYVFYGVESWSGVVERSIGVESNFEVAYHMVKEP